MSQIMNGIIMIAMAIIGVAILAVLVSQKANTSAVLGAASNAFSGALGAAEAPVTGQTIGGGLGSISLPNFGGSMGMMA